MTVAAHTLDRRHGGAVCYNGRTFATEGICDHNHKLDVALGDWHAAAGLFSLSSFAALRIQRRRCGVPVFPGVSIHRRFHRQASGAATTTLLFSRCLFFHPRRRPKGLLLPTASQIRMHRTNPHCAHA
jgi:hypothetical protein